MPPSFAHALPRTPSEEGFFFSGSPPFHVQRSGVLVFSARWHYKSARPDAPPGQPHGRRDVTTNQERIAKEEEYWNGPRLFGLGIAFLTASIIVIYILSSI